MRRKRLAWKLFPVYFTVTTLSLLGFLLLLSRYFLAFHESRIHSDLVIRTRLLSAAAAGAVASSAEDNRQLASLIRNLAASSRVRVTVIDPDGTVLADSEFDPATMENHADRPEFRTAMEGRVGTARRISPTLGVRSYYTAVPIKHNGRITAVIRTAIESNRIERIPPSAFLQMALAALLIAAAAGAVSIALVRRISHPILELKKTADRFASGDFRSRAPVPDTEELAGLAEALNTMASQLDHYVRTVTERSTEQNAILASMQEGVVATDNDDRILIVNPAAEGLLGIELNAVKGRTIQEAIRNPEIQRFLERTRGAREPIMDEIVLRESGERVVQITGTALVDSAGNRIGVLAVLNEITRTRKLETLRRDFVANVSHELKTPITSIKGFVETLREGAINDPEKAREFLAIVARQSDRLNAIIEDLLSLSRIEQEAEAAEIQLEVAPIRPVIEAAVLDCQSKANEAQVSVSLQIDDSLRAPINAPLLEQAVANLLDNAIKYAPQGEVTIAASQQGSEVVISVTDNGCGIEPEHIPRLFERFYRVDKARSRKLGGTGLGLAIVKHIVQAHQGRIEVNSSPGKGSTFSVFIPGAQG